MSCDTDAVSHGQKKDEKGQLSGVFAAPRCTVAPTFVSSSFFLLFLSKSDTQMSQSQISKICLSFIFDSWLCFVITGMINSRTRKRARR